MAPNPDSPEAAVAVLRAYYDAIREQRYEDAYRLWGYKGEASGKTFEQFRSGFSETATVEVTPGEPGAIGAAAGSRYVDIPVRVVAKLRNGDTQEFTGTYTMRRSVVDGATPEQRAWHIYTAKISQVR